ncbi:MAG TPA: MFS transporter [Amaricoccus sp.]|uniref:MFS transporter n=1 Tax=Amaricoccus sp. TaxID=1872485 RepID=UPI002C96CF8B|nr:MFS transporter [Amaricoccus sp.]HMQ92639.1 MFS transporter [Amaricoccus sp.]HMR52887.1 MFS transporter [Amaricoccus sp.]HMR59243.1 MFS transporter [Amaricoccus sp.]HMT97736.1 MFS transporter [Amaricoccus sp.]
MSDISDDRPRGFSLDLAVRAPAGSVAADMDRLALTWLHIAVAVVAGLGFAFDLVEIALGNVLSAVFNAPPYSVTPAQLSWLLSAMYIGAIPGALIAGLMADRYGRRRVLVAVLLVLCVTSIAAAGSPDIGSLILWRIVSGLALGAYPPLMMSFIADVMPPKRRGTVTMVIVGIASLGPVAMIFGVRALADVQPLGLEGWRWAFIAGAVGALIVAGLFQLIPESPRWLAVRGHHAEAQAALARFERSAIAVPNPASAALEAAEAAPPDAGSYRPPVARFAIVGAIYFVTPWATVAFPVLMGAVLIEKGLSLSDSLFYVGISMFGPAIGAVMSSTFVDRIKRRTALMSFATGMIIAATVFAATMNPLWLMAAGVSFQLFTLLYVPTMTIYAAELFPTPWRARTSTAAWSLNRLASAIAPLVLVPLLKFYGIWPMFGLIIGTLVVGIVLVAMAPEGRAGRAVS